MSEPLHWMQRALALGREGLGTTWPNPSVGCVIVKDGAVVGEARTAEGGRPHAETQALSQAGVAARGADVFVTLEPCAHLGQTGPCAVALIEAGVARVFAPLSDTDARVNGAGFAILRAAGVEVITGLCAAEAARDHAGFIRVAQGGLPWVTLKLATSFDGRIATASGESRWITSAPARAMTQELRASHDAVMIGAGTAREDNPKLTLRGYGTRRPPLRVVLSAGLDLPLDGFLAQSAADIPLTLIHAADAPLSRREAWSQRGARLLEVPRRGGALDLHAALAALAQGGVTRILSEGGGQVAAGLLAAGLADEVLTLVAGLALGADARPSVGPLGLAALDQAPRFALTDVRRVGADAALTWQPLPANG